MPLHQKNDRRTTRFRGFVSLLLWLAVPAAALVLLLASVLHFSIPEYSLRISDPSSGSEARATWSAPDDPRVCVLLLTGAEGSPPGTRMLVSDLHRRGAAVLQLPLPANGRDALVKEGADAVSERYGGLLPETVVAFGSVSKEALSYASDNTIERMVLVDPESASTRFPVVGDGTSVALLSVGHADHSEAEKTLYESLSGDDTVILPPASGAGRITSTAYLSADGHTLLARYPSLPADTGLAVPVVRDTVIRWALPESEQPTAEDPPERTLIPVYAALILAAGALVPLVFPRSFRVRNVQIVPAFAALLLPAVFRRRRALDLEPTGAGLAAGCRRSDGGCRVVCRRSPFGRERIRPTRPYVCGRCRCWWRTPPRALLVWLAGPRTLVLALSIFGGAGCAWGYARGRWIPGTVRYGNVRVRYRFADSDDVATGNEVVTEKEDKMKKASIRVDHEYTIGAVDRRLFGSFVEHLGRAVYGGIYETGPSRGGRTGIP